MDTSADGSTDHAAMMVTQLHATLVARRATAVAELAGPDRLDPMDETSARLEAALARCAGFSGDARVRALAAADRLIDALPITDVTRVRRAIVEPSAANLRAAVETLSAATRRRSTAAVLRPC